MTSHTSDQHVELPESKTLQPQWDRWVNISALLFPIAMLMVALLAMYAPTWKLSSEENVAQRDSGWRRTSQGWVQTQVMDGAPANSPLPRLSSNGLIAVCQLVWPPASAACLATLCYASLNRWSPGVSELRIAENQRISEKRTSST